MYDAIHSGNSSLQKLCGEAAKSELATLAVKSPPAYRHGEKADVAQIFCVVQCMQATLTRHLYAVEPASKWHVAFNC